MSNEPSRSPAVATLRSEQSRQSDNGSDLTSGLTDTFPASDPVAMTGNTTAGGVIETNFGVQVDPAPKVDAALAAVRARSPSEREEMALAELRAMKDELTLLARDASRVRVQSRRSFKAPKFLPANVDREIRLHPIATVVSAFLFGYVFGIAR